jgi:DNA polymerase III subunit delta'
MSFQAIEGQERAVRLLKQSLKTGKLHHAYLFSGLDGIGKKKTALELAKALNCRRPGPEGSCDQCDSCLKLEKGSHPDFIHLQPEGTSQFIRIHQIRSLEEQINFPPYMGGVRVCLIDKASNLKIEGANAFLKTLEEPPAGNVFVLLVNDLGEILSTLVSRCLAIAFIPLPFSLIARKLEKEGATPEEAASLSRLSGGSLGRAIQYKQTGFWGRHQAWLEQLEALSPHKSAVLLEGIKKWLGSREEMLEKLEIGRGCLRDILGVALGLTSGSELPPEVRGRVAALAARHPAAVWLKRLTLIDRAAEYLAGPANAQLAWEMLWLKMARMVN